MHKPDMNKAKMRYKEKVNTISKYKIVKGQPEIGKDKTYYVETYGCQMNVHDSELIKAILEDMSYTKAPTIYEADLVILNTCAIRENVHQKVYGMLGRLKHLKKIKPTLMVGLCGCMAQEEIVVETIMEKYKWLDFLFGTHNLYTLPEVLSKAIANQKTIIDVWSKEGDLIENIPFKRDSNYKAWVNIIYGCDKFCTYCIVPYVRGKERSRKKEAIIKEVKELIKKGYREITLLGQNVNAYGKDVRDSNYRMENLLADLSKLDIKRIRFITSHPWDFTDEMIQVIKQNSNIMPHIHLPVQSGSDKILKLMGRKYTKKEYITLVNKLRKNIPHVSLSTDIIVGFPKETEEDFKATLDLYKKIKFDFAFTFIFSPRKGTPAFKFKDDTLLKDKEKRLKQLNELVNKYALKSNKKLLNKTVKVLIEGKDLKYNKLLTGYTENNKLVNLEGSDELIGKIVDVTITDVKTWSLKGKVNN